jgi:hypothetical protein
LRRAVAKWGAAALIIAATGGPALALVSTGEVCGVQFCVYAPDWAWQSSTVNVMIRVNGDEAQAADLKPSLVLPEDSPFGLEPPKLRRIGSNIAFTGLRLRADAPLGTNSLSVTIANGDDTVTVPYPLRVVRGPLLNPSRWAVAAPVGVSLVWVVLFAFVMSRFARKRAWRSPSEPYEPPEGPPTWCCDEPPQADEGKGGEDG